jgi:hypothetical protein
LPRRKALARELAPDLEAAEIEAISLQTRGFDREQFVQAVRTLALTGQRPPTAGSLDDVAPVDIDVDVMEEGYTHRAYIEPALTRAGFEVSCYPLLLHSRRSGWLQPVGRLLPQLLFATHRFDQVIVYVGRASKRQRP